MDHGEVPPPVRRTASEFRLRRVTRGELNFAGNEPAAFFVRGDKNVVRFLDWAGEACVDTPLDTRGVGLADLNGDGALDLVVQTRTGTLVFRNRVRELIPERNIIQILLRNKEPNPFAIGARIQLRTADDTKLIQEVTAGSGYLSQKSVARSFGLAKHTAAQLRVRWPDGVWEEIGLVPANQRVIIDRGEPSRITFEPLAGDGERRSSATNGETRFQER